MIKPKAKVRTIQQNSYKKGKFAENYAAFWLRLKGYKILATRFKTPVGEIDLIAQKGKYLIAIEVKARQTKDAALHSISQKQWKRIAKSLSWYQKQNHVSADSHIRFDAIFILPFNKLSHFKPIHKINAWELPLGLYS